MSSKRLINTEIDNLSALHDLRKNMQLFCQNQDNQDACNKVMETYNALLNDEDVKEYSEHTRILARKYLEDAGAKGETLEELAEDLKTKAVDLKGGRTLTKHKK